MVPDEKGPAAKKQKVSTDMTESTLEQRISSLEKKSDGAVTQLKDQVRSLCLQNSPSEPLILLTFEELARVTKRQGDTDAELYEELARQAKLQQGQLDLAQFF